MSPTTTEAPAPLPADLRGVDVTSPDDVAAVQRITDTIDAMRGAGTDGSLDAALEAAGIGNTVTPWVIAAVAVVIVAVAVAVVIVGMSRGSRATAPDPEDADR